MITADLRFHEAIYLASGNPMIAQSAQRHWHHIRRAMGAVLQVSTMRESIWDEHKAISSAIAASDKKRRRITDTPAWRRCWPQPGRSADARLEPFARNLAILKFKGDFS